MDKKEGAGICAYCGASDKVLTRDHVVPKAFWKDRPLPSHTVTVPACQPCQIEWDQDATYFRNLIVISSDPSDHPAITNLAQGAIRRSVTRSRRERNDLTRNFVRGYHQAEAGKLFEPYVRIDVESRRIDRTPEKIVRGLFFFRNKFPVPCSYDVRIVPGNLFWQDPGFQNILATMEPWKTMGDDVFAMRATRDEQDSNFTVWLMVFYKSSAVLGFTCPKNYGQTPLL